MWPAGHPAGAVRNPTNPLRTALPLTPEGCNTLSVTVRPCCLPHTPDCCGPRPAAPRQQHPTGGRGRCVTAAAAAPHRHGLTSNATSTAITTSSCMASYCPQHTVFVARPPAPRTVLAAAGASPGSTTTAAAATAMATAPYSPGAVWGPAAPHRRASVQCSAVRSRRRRTDVSESGTEAVPEELADSATTSSNGNHGNGVGGLSAGVGSSSSGNGVAEGQVVPAARSSRRRVRTQSPAAAAAAGDQGTQEAADSSSGSTEARTSGVQGASAPSAALDRDPASMKVAELQAALQALGLPRSGRKDELLARLLAATATATQQGAAAEAQHQSTATEAAKHGAAEEQPAAAAGAGAGAGTGLVRRRRATRQAEDATGTSAALAAAPAAPVAEKGAASGASDDASLTDLFSAMDLSITVQEKEVGPQGGRRQAPPPPQQQQQEEEEEREAEASEPRGPRRRVQAMMGRGSQGDREEEEQEEGTGTSAAADAGPQPGALRRRLRSRVAAGDGHVDGSMQVQEVQKEVGSTLPLAEAAAVEDVGAGAEAGTGIRRRRRVEGAGPVLEGERGSAAQPPQGLEQQQQQHAEQEEQLQGQGTGRVLRRRVRTADTTAEAGVGAAAAAPAPEAPAKSPAEAPAEEAPREARFGRRGRTADPPPLVEGEGVDLTDLGPWPQQFMGRPTPVSWITTDPEEQERLLVWNQQGLVVTALGTAAFRATRRRALSSLALCRGKDLLVFNAGDDTQRQVGSAYHVKPSKCYRIFITSLAPECTLGVPGMLCTINASRERGHELTDIPVHVYGPAGTADFLATMMRVSKTFLEITVVVYEFSQDAPPPRPPPSDDHDDVEYDNDRYGRDRYDRGGRGRGGYGRDADPAAAADEAARALGAEAVLAANRARIYRITTAPDQLNPRGGVDASLTLFAPDQGRSHKRKGRNASGGVLAHDERAGYLPWPPLTPGDPGRGDLDPYTLTWTLELDVTARVVVNLLPGPEPSLAYTVVEADRGGALVTERAQRAGLNPGPHYADLKAGRPAYNRYGQLIAPELVISPTRPGRRVVVLGPTTDPRVMAAWPHARGADLIVPGPTWLEEEAELAAQAGGCTASAMGSAVRQLQARYVMVGCVDGWRASEEEDAEDERAAAQQASKAPLIRTVSAAASAPSYAVRVARELAAAAYGSRGRAVEASAEGALGMGGAVAGAGAGAGAKAGAGAIPRVFVVEDLDSMFVDKNEGPDLDAEEARAGLLPPV